MRRCRLVLVVSLVLVITSFVQNVLAQPEFITEKEARNTAQTQVLEPPVFPEFEDANLGSGTLFRDLNGTPSAYVFALNSTERVVGYVTVSARSSFYPLFEASTGPVPTSRVHRARQLVEEQDPLFEIAEESLIYLGTLDYFAEFISASGDYAYVSLKTLTLIPVGGLQESQALYDQTASEIRSLAQSAWRQSTDLEQQTKLSKLNPDPSSDTDKHAYEWYRGCMPTSGTMLLSWFAKNNSLYSELDYPIRRFDWSYIYEGKAYTRKVHIPRALTDHLADELGLAASGADSNDYGVAPRPLAQKIESISVDHGHVVYSWVDGMSRWTWFWQKFGLKNLYEKFRNRIDANQPFLLQFAGSDWSPIPIPSNPTYNWHSTFAYGYDYSTAGHRVYLFDTWDRAEHLVTLENQSAGYGAGFVHAGGVAANGSGEQLSLGTIVEKPDEEVDSLDTNYYTYFIDNSVSDVTVSIDGEGWGWGGAGLVSYGYDPRYLVAAYKAGQQKPEEVRTSDGNFLHDWSTVVENSDYERLVVAISARKDRGEYTFSIESNDADPSILAPTNVSPELVGPGGAPYKLQIRVKVETDQGTVIHGLAGDDFSVRIGASDANVLTVRELAESYILETQPPAQSSDGAYDLTVTVLGNSDTETDAIQYSSLAKSNVDTMLVIDRSGSMGGTPIERARNSAKLFVDLMNVDDMVGVASFNSSSYVNHLLTVITSTAVKDEVMQAIDGIGSGGSTSIGAGLRDGYEELTNKANSNHPWSIVLLSDGQENSSPYVADVLPSVVATKMKVFAIGLGSVDESLMQDIAYQTNGEYYYTPSDAQLAELYNSISGQVAGRQTLYNASNSVQQGETRMDSVRVDGSVDEAVFSVTWNNPSSDLDLTLESPSGRNIDPQVASSDPNVEFVSGDTYEYYKVYQPEPGDWMVSVFGATASTSSMAVTQAANQVAGEAYNLTAQAVSNLTLDVDFDKRSYQAGDAINLQVSLADSEPLAQARVVARIQRPDLTTDTLSLFDDGMHADGAADDGVYSGFYSRTYDPGSYQFKVEASGRASAGYSFKRLFDLSAVVADAVDGDADGMPDNWEGAVGLDDTVDDSGDDPDGDALTNLDEYQNGTDPFTADTDGDGLEDGEEVNTWKTNPTNPDTDLGGEPDGSEVDGGRDPTDPRDDRISSVYLPLALRTHRTSTPTWSGPGLSGLKIYAVTTVTTDCTTLYVGTADGIYKSSDAGATWSPSGLHGQIATSVALDPSAPQTVYGATWGQGVYRSHDGGGSWTQVNGGLGSKLFVFPLAIAPDGSALYAGTYDGGVLKSTDAGSSWSPANSGLGNLNIRSLAIDPGASSVVYAGTTNGVYKSTDRAASWSAASSGLSGRTVRALGVHPSSGATVFAGTDAGVYRSTDGGASWTQVGVNGTSVLSLVVDPLEPQQVYAGTDGSGVYRSANGGDGWTGMNAGLGDLTIESLTLDDGPCRALQAGTHSGVWRYSE